MNIHHVHHICHILYEHTGFSGGSDGKECACSSGEARDTGLIPGSGRSPGEGNGYPLQNSCLENSMDRGAWRVTVHGVAKNQTQLSNLTTTPKVKYNIVSLLA